jgi:peptidoglycan/LPS O-acetylase OafA/YrhL
MMLHTRIDTIMLGCIFALAIDSGFARQLLAHFAKSYALVAAVIYMFFVSPYLAERFAGSYWLPLGFTLQGVSALILLIYVTSRPKSHLGTVLNNRFIKFIGVLSYSLYLWQQMFTGANTRDFPMNLVIILAFGLTSYFLVEKPALSLRSAFLHGASQGAEGRITAAA